MAKLDHLPEKHIIDGFKGTVDYYYWKGIPVSRKWPVYRPYAASIQQVAARTAFAYINKLYATLPLIIVQALQAHATGTTQVSKDYLVRAYLRGLFTMAPPDYFATEETQLEILAELLQKLETADLHIHDPSLDLWVRIAQSVLPDGAATQTTLNAVLARLQAMKITPVAPFNYYANTTNLAPGALWQPFQKNGIGTLLSFIISSNSPLCRWNFYLDNLQPRDVLTSGQAPQPPRFDRINAIGGLGANWRLLQYDAGVPSYIAKLEYQMPFEISAYCWVTNDDAVNINVSVTAFGHTRT